MNPVLAGSQRQHPLLQIAWAPTGLTDIMDTETRHLGLGDMDSEMRHLEVGDMDSETKHLEPR